MALTGSTQMGGFDSIRLTNLRQWQTRNAARLPGKASSLLLAPVSENVLTDHHARVYSGLVTGKPKNISRHAWAKHQRLTASLTGGKRTWKKTTTSAINWS